MTRGASKPLIIFAAGTFAVAGIGGYAWFESVRPPVLEVYVFDTPGQPSIFIRTPNDRRVLIGGGANADIIRRLTSVLPFYSRRIDMVIVPDTDAKNVTGLVEAVERYSVAKALVPEVTLMSLGLSTSTDPAYDAFHKAIEDRAVPVAQISPGAQVPLDHDVNMSVLFPADPASFKYSKASGPSLVFKIEYGSTSILFMGSAAPKIQKLFASSSDARADALVVSHSLSASNFAKDLFTKIQPGYLVYSQSAKKPPQNPAVIPGILGDRRFNLQERGVVKIISDGHFIDMKKEL